MIIDFYRENTPVGEAFTPSRGRA